MATILSEDFAAGNSLFSTVYRYNRTGVFSEAQDPLYPYIWVSEGLYINGDGRLDKNPIYTAPSESYQNAGLWIKGAGALTGGGSGIFSGSGFWDGTSGCIEALYQPTVASLGEHSGGNICPLILVATPAAFTNFGVEAHLDEGFLAVYQSNEGESPDDATIPGAPMPVAGQPYKVRLGWQCGTFDQGAQVTAPDGFMRVWINDVLVYEVTDISLYVAWQTVPGNRLDSVLFGYFGLLGPLEYFTISDSACAATTPIQFGAGVVERPLIWMKHTLKVVP